MYNNDFKTILKNGNELIKKTDIILKEITLITESNTNKRKEMIELIIKAIKENNLEHKISKKGDWGTDAFINGKSDSLFIISQQNKDKKIKTIKLLKKILGNNVIISEDNYNTIFLNDKNKCIKEYNHTTTDSFILNEKYIIDPIKYFLLNSYKDIKCIDIDKEEIYDSLEIAIKKYLELKENNDELFDNKYIYIAYSYSYDYMNNIISYNGKLEIKSKESYTYTDKKKLLESKIDKNKAYPLYLITSFTFTPLGKLITKITDSSFSHASLSLDNKLKEMYSFNFNYKNPLHDNGLVKEDINNLKLLNSNSIMQVSILFLKEKDVKKIKEILEDMIIHKERYHYHILGLLNVLFNIKKVNDFKMICSEFVANILDLLSIDIFSNKSKNLISPHDISMLSVKNSKVYTVFNGYIKDYNYNLINILNSKIDDYEYIKENDNVSRIESYKTYDEIYVLETKEFPIDFDRDGNLIIQNYKKLDFESEYSKSHKLLISYTKYNNLNGIKYELSKLWFMNIILEKKIYEKPNEEKLIEYTKVRARILNDFNKYLDFVLSKENNFNFTEYYNNSPFSDVKIKINGTLITGLVDLFKQII